MFNKNDLLFKKIKYFTLKILFIILNIKNIGNNFYKIFNVKYIKIKY